MRLKYLFPFVKGYPNLQQRWWHRFFVVLFVLVMVTGAIISFAGWFSSFPKSSYNLVIGETLDSYTRASDSNGNTIDSFSALGGQLACYEGGRVTDVFSYTLGKYGYCNKNLKQHEDEWIDHLLAADAPTSVTKETIKEQISNTPSFYNGGVCIFSKAYDECKTPKYVVHYHPNVIYYLEALIASILSIYALGLVLQILYYKVFIYIAKGSPKQGQVQ